MGPTFTPYLLTLKELTLMQRNMKQWLADIIASPVKKAMPVLSFPSTQLMGITVRQLISDSDLQAKGIALVAERTDAAAAVSLMDLSVEAECFGSVIHISDDEVPTVVGSIITTREEADTIAVPEIGAGRTQIYIDAIEKSLGMIQDRPVLAGVIGPFSLTGRLMDVTEVMMYCYEDPDMVHAVLDKVTSFIIKYILAYKAVGANGVVVAEPLAGLLSPEFGEEFSAQYMKKIVEAVQDENFIVVYHNCGNSTIHMVDSIVGIGAGALHFGNAIDMAEMMPHIPAHIPAMGNVEPAGQFRNGTPESVRENTLEIMEKCCKYPNFVISSGCDIPPLSPWENIDAFFAAVQEYYQR